MQVTTTDKLTFAYTQKLDRYNYIAGAIVIVFFTTSFLWMFFHIGGVRGNIIFGDATYAVSALIGAIWAYRTTFLAHYGPLRLGVRHQLAWALIGTGLIAECLGGTYYLYLEYIEQSPFPSYADLFFNLAYALLFLGILCMPTLLHFRARMGLDAFITTLCIFSISWFFLIGPAYFLQRDHVSQLELFTALSYPVWDVVMILAIALLIQRRTAPVLHSSLIILAIGILSNIWADSGYAYQNVFGSYTTGTFYIDSFWCSGFLLIGFSSLHQYGTVARRAFLERTPPYAQSMSYDNEQARKRQDTAKSTWRSIQSLIIYIPLMILFGLTVYGEIYRENEVARDLVIITAFVGILVGMRYLVATRENEQFLQERQQQHREAEQLRYLNTQLTDILNVEQLQEQIVTQVVSELEFDAAMLVLIEEHDQPVGEHSHLLVHTATTRVHRYHKDTGLSVDIQHTHWQFQGPNILLDTVKSGKITEIIWNHHVHTTPQEVYAWQQEQQIPPLLFFPLFYHEKLLGCLGIARRATTLSMLHDIALIKTYAEQVAAAVEHAHLYQERGEHEAFAHAMANLATRLNAAVVEPAEIRQLICSEAAYALRADYTLLYIEDGKEQLVPIASFVGDQAPQPQNEWPPIRIYEYEAHAFSSLQPVLISLQHAPLASQPLSPPGNGLQHSTPLPVVRLTSMREQRKPYTLRDQLIRCSVSTAIFAPLIARGNVAGLLVLARTASNSTRNKKMFDEHDLSYVQDFAEQAAVAFTNAQLYQSIRTAHQQLQELDKLKDQFMTTASHELRTPLTAVQGYIELLAQYGDTLPQEQRHEFLQKARRSCDELVVMLGNVMDANRLEIESGIRPAFFERIAVREMLDSVLDLIGPQLTKEQREVQVHIPQQLAVMADPARLRQVLMNICVNALKYSPPRTPLILTARVATTTHATGTTSWVIIGITDRGNGIPPQEQKKLFQRFSRLERDINSPVRGSGLGLYISQSLIKAMGGKISVESRGIPGEGSTFYIQLPTA